jgi:hypothetical protein
MTTFSKLAAAALAFIALAGAGPAAANAWGLPSTAYFIVDLNYCTPGGLTGPRPAPVGDVAVVYNEVLIGAYGGNCDAFYAREVRPRLFLSPEES